MSDSIFNFKNYPIVFIGSGMSKRYLNNFPTWQELLEEYWAKLNNKTEFYSYLTELKNKYENEIEDTSALNHKINTEAATYIESEFNNLFNSNKIPLDGLTTKKAYLNNISPFKYSLCQKFSPINLRNDLDQDELESYKVFLTKARMIITTNYDAFIEKLLSEKSIMVKKYIGNEGFFDDSVGWSELYKIHGDISNPNSIIINKKDYESYDQKSILISAKILSNMINRPIIFIGYSLTDRNVTKLLSDFSSQLPKEDNRKSASRIIVIERKDQENEIKLDQIVVPHLQITYTLIKTDNYKKIFDEISTINEGLLPSEILKYQQSIKTIIEQEGQKGELDKILVSTSDLNKINNNSNLVVALGDKRFIYTQVKEPDYLSDYLLEKNQISIKLALEFISNLVSSTRIPFSNLLKSYDIKELNLTESTINKINKRIKKHGKLSFIINQLKDGKNNIKTEFDSIDQIEKLNFKKYKEIRAIIINIHKFEVIDLKKYVINNALPLFNQTSDNHLKTELKRLFLAYDLLINGDITQVLQLNKYKS